MAQHLQFTVHPDSRREFVSGLSVRIYGRLHPVGDLDAGESCAVQAALTDTTFSLLSEAVQAWSSGGMLRAAWGDRPYLAPVPALTMAVIAEVLRRAHPDATVDILGIDDRSPQTRQIDRDLLGS